MGARFGAFLDKIVKAYVPRSGVTAMEYGNDAIRTLLDKFYFAIQEDIRTAKLDYGFDAIFLFQVAEHMDNIDKLFARLSELLRADGL